MQGYGKTFRAVLLVGAFLTMLGCATVGKNFPVELVPQIQTGKTTQSDIERMFGKPWRTGLDNGKVSWTYGKYRYSLFSPTHTNDLVIRFDPNKVVESWTYNAD
ncbi:MAG: hypothetical protein BWK76_07030 [Desulfobulbaceae bacterium A2]|nr:MAG: hypothetical protein BWK76_07030 [Desulfobulbaceae bacterium A2]